MKAIPWLVVGVALVAIMILAFIGTTGTVDNTTGVDQDALNQALQDSLRDSYAPHLIDVTPTPIAEDASP
jgi:hypothetical protein